MLLFNGQLSAEHIMTPSEKRNKNTKPDTPQTTAMSCNHAASHTHTHTRYKEYVKHSPLDEALEQAVQDVAAIPHEPDVLRRAVDTLAVQDGSLEHVAELLPRAQEVGPHEVHHAPVLHQVVLQRVAGQHHTPPRPDVLQSL